MTRAEFTSFLFLKRVSILLLLCVCTLCTICTGCGFKPELVPKFLDNIQNLSKEYKDVFKNLLQNCRDDEERDQLRVEIRACRNEDETKVFLKKKAKLDKVNTKIEQKLRKLSSFQRKEVLQEIQNFTHKSNTSPTVVEIEKIIDDKEKIPQVPQNNRNQCNDEWGDRLTLYGEDRELFKNIIIAFPEEDQKKLKSLFNEPNIHSQNIDNFCKVFLKFDSDHERTKILEALMYIYKLDRALALKICNARIGLQDKMRIMTKAKCYIPIFQKLLSLILDLD